MGPGGQEHRRTQRCVHMDADSSKRVCAGCGEAMPAAEGWHKCSKCKAPVHSHITCSKVHSDPCDEESHICDSCFVGSKEQPGSPTSASSPGEVAAAGMLLSLAAAASGEDAARKSAAASETSDVGIRTSLIASQGTSGTASSCSRPVIISQSGQTREHARHTPRTESGMYKPPPVGADWTWNPRIIGADGAEAGPNGIATVCKETDASYVPHRGHCSVHEQRNVQQNKHNVFTGESKQKEEMAVTVTSMMEKVKNHSVTVPLATLGKRMIADYLHDKGQEDAEKWFERHHQHHKWTLIEMNDGTDAGGGVPCHANAIERTNLQQKKDAKWERQKVLQFAQSQAEQVSQLSMNDLSFGDKMPRGYIQELGSGSSKIRNNKEVWTVNFFDTVKAEMRDPVGLNKLVWKVNWGQYPEGSLIMCSRQMRRWLLQDDAFADHYKAQKDKLQCMKKALNTKTTLDGKPAPSYINQYKRLILDGDKYTDEQSMTFNDFIDWQSSFHILQPLTNEVYIRDLVTRLQNSGLVLDQDVVGKLYGDEPEICMYKCSCGRYMHYLWCLHVMLRAIDVKLVMAPYCPATMDSSKIQHVRGVKAHEGRPAKAKPGEALSKG